MEMRTLSYEWYEPFGGGTDGSVSGTSRSADGTGGSAAVRTVRRRYGSFGGWYRWFGGGTNGSAAVRIVRRVVRTVWRWYKPFGEWYGRLSGR
ncbi:MAG: hypothetical protein KDJ65_30990 [Anaerolineae bacterium]|nr:hypothetical protein [Anaerolineae bacterium]